MLREITLLLSALLLSSCGLGGGREASPTSTPTAPVTSTSTPTLGPTSTRTPAVGTDDTGQRYSFHPLRLEVEDAGVCGFVWGATNSIGGKRFNYSCEHDVWGLDFPYWGVRGLVIDTVQWTGDHESSPTEVRRVTAMSVVNLDDPRCLGLASIDASECLAKLFRGNPAMVSTDNTTPTPTP